MICNHYTPIPVKRKPRDEALMFRVSETQGKEHKLHIEIQWDNGDRETIYPVDINFLHSWIAIYYDGLNTTKSRKRLWDWASRNPILISKLRTACYWIGEKTDLYLKAPGNATGFKKLKIENLSRTRMLEQELYIHKIKPILRRFGLRSVDKLLKSREAQNDEGLRRIKSLHEEEQVLKDADLSIFKDHLTYYHEIEDLSFLRTDNERIGMIKSDMDDVFLHLARETLDSRTLTLSSKMIYDLVIQMSELLINIAQYNESYGNWIRSEFSYMIRSIMQSIFREVHDRPPP